MDSYMLLTVYAANNMPILLTVLLLLAYFVVPSVFVEQTYLMTHIEHSSWENCRSYWSGTESNVNIDVSCQCKLPNSNVCVLVCQSYFDVRDHKKLWHSKTLETSLQRNCLFIGKLLQRVEQR